MPSVIARCLLPGVLHILRWPSEQRVLLLAHAVFSESHILFSDGAALDFNASDFSLGSHRVTLARNCVSTSSTPPPPVHLLCFPQCKLHVDAAFRVFLRVLLCYRDRGGGKKNSHSIPVLYPLSGRLAIVLLDPCAAQMECEGGRLAGGRSVNGIYISARTCGEQKKQKKELVLL